MDKNRKTITNLPETMYNELRERAKKRTQAKMAFFIAAMGVTLAVAILILLTFFVGPAAAFWLRFTVLCLMFALGILYTLLIALPRSGFLSKDWQEEETEKELSRMYRKRRMSLPPPEQLSEEDRLELQELERLQEKWYGEEDYV